MIRSIFSQDHRHPREIDCSLAIVGGLATGAECGGKSKHLPCMWHQKVLHKCCCFCGWLHKYYRQQRQADWANEQSTSLKCLWLGQIQYKDIEQVQVGQMSFWQISIETNRPTFWCGGRNLSSSFVQNKSISSIIYFPDLSDRK